MKKYLPLFIILAIAAFLRLYQLNSLPISLFGDEVDVGYHAWSLWTTGRDYTGNFLPTYIHSLSEWRAPLLMYIAAPFVGILGPTAFSVRLPVALLGILSIYLLYLLVTKLFNRKIALVVAFILTVSPWHIHYSRAAFEVTLLLSLLLLGINLFIRHRLTSSLFFFALTFYTYSVANLFTPILVILLFFVFRPKLTNKTILSFIFPLIILLPIMYQLIFGPAAGRFNIISIFNDRQLTDFEVVSPRTEPWITSGLIETVFHNKPIAYLTVIGRHYFQSFSPDFLFLRGDPNFRHSVAQFGELPWLLAPLFFLGLLRSWYRPNRSIYFFIFWLLLAPLPSAITKDGGTHATRLFIMLPPLMVLSSLGFEYLVDSVSRHKISKHLYFILVVAFLTFVANYWHFYASHYRYQSASSWNWGFRQAFDQLNDLPSTGRIFINNTYAPSLIQFAYLTKIPPRDFQQMFTTDVHQENIVSGFNGFRFGDKYYFGKVQSQGKLQDLLQPGDLYLAAQFEELPGNWDWSQIPPHNLLVIGQVRDLHQAVLFFWITYSK